MFNAINFIQNIETREKNIGKNSRRIIMSSFTSITNDEQMMPLKFLFYSWKKVKFPAVTIIVLYVVFMH